MIRAASGKMGPYGSNCEPSLSPGARRRAQICAAFLWLLVPPLEGRSCRVDLIPNGKRFNCSNCHTSQLGGGARNLFGRDVEALVRPGACSTFWSPDLAAKDSDGDGVTNGKELQDPGGTWAPGSPQPGDPALATNPGVASARFIRGDSNSDGVINVADAINTLHLLFAGENLVSCQSAADATADGIIDIADATYTLSYLFSGGKAPRAPFPACQDSQALFRLDCKSYPPCGHGEG